jgi:segregation and condensation protein A
MPEDHALIDDIAERRAAEALIVDVDGFEGPLDLLLTLSRTQKVDLRKISVLQLAEQYLAFIDQAKALRIELAADYLVMAAWLAFLKSRLLLPPDPVGRRALGRGSGRASGVPAGTLAGHARGRGQADGARPERARFLRARDAEDVARVRKVTYTATLLDLMQAYARIRTKDEFRPYALTATSVFTMEQALDRMRGLIGFAGEWTDLISYLPEGWAGDPASAAVRDGGDLRGLAGAGEGREGRDPAVRDLRADPAAGAGQRTRLKAFRARKPVRGAAAGRAGTHGRGDPVRHGRADHAWPRCRRGCRMAATRPRRLSSCASATRGAACRWCAWAMPGRSARRPILAFSCEGDGRDAEAVARGDRDAGHHRLSPARDPRRDRGDPWRLGQPGHGRPADLSSNGSGSAAGGDDPGRPVTFVVTQGFLDHFGLESARDLPGLKELREAGLLDSHPAEAEAPDLPEDDTGQLFEDPEEPDDDPEA